MKTKVFIWADNKWGIQGVGKLRTLNEINEGEHEIELKLTKPEYNALIMAVRKRCKEEQPGTTYGILIDRVKQKLELSDWDNAIEEDIFFPDRKEEW